MNKILYKGKSMIPWKYFASISPYLISEERRNISNLWAIQGETVTLNKYVDEYEEIWKFMIEIFNKLHGRGIKIDNQFDSPCQTIDFFQHLTSRCSLRRHHELSFSLRWACIYLSLYYTPCLLLTILEKKSRLPFKISSCCYSLSHEVVIGSQSWVVTHFPM